MVNGSAFLEIIIYTIILWLGFYLIGRDPAKPQLRLAGLGLIIYALSLGGDLLTSIAPSAELRLSLARLHWPLLFLPALFWFGAVVYRLPDTGRAQIHIRKTLNYVLLPFAAALYLFTISTNLVFDFSQFPPQVGPAYFVFALAVLLPLLAAVVVAAGLFSSTQPKTPLGLLLLALLFLGLGAGLLVLPLNLLPRIWFLVAISVDFIVLGIVIAMLDAFDEGETLLPDLLRSLAYTAYAVGLFAGLVVLAMVTGTGASLSLFALLLLAIGLAIINQTFSAQIQTLLDRLVFSPFPQLWQTRARLRTIANSLPRVDESLNLERLADDEFSRLTRQALSHMGNLPRMATNPLTRLPLIDTRLSDRNAADNTLERAAELKILLAESIVRLKPRHKGDFGTSEEWRYYNALYFPYVVGLKPYSRRADHNGLEPSAQEALTWFRTYVPERTLYNWQNAAAKLVAQDLKERTN